MKTNKTTMTRATIFSGVCMAALLCCSMPASAAKTVRHFEIKEQLDKLEVSASIEVIYTPTNARDGMRFRLEGEEEKLDCIMVQQVGDKLIFKLKPDVNAPSAKDVQAYISMPPVSSISVTSAGTVTVDGDFDSEKSLTLYASVSGSINMNNVYLSDNSCLDVSTSSSGSIDMDDAFAGTFKATSSSSGNIDINNLTADTATIRCSSSGEFETEMKVNALTASSSSNGNMSLSGIVGNASLTASSNGEIDAEDLTAKRVSISESRRTGGKIIGFGKADSDDDDDELNEVKARNVKLEMP